MPIRPQPIWAVFYCADCGQRNAGRLSPKLPSCSRCQSLQAYPKSALCPHRGCGQWFDLLQLQELRCPHCRKPLDNGIPIFPAPLQLTLLDRLVPSRSARKRAIWDRSLFEYGAIYGSWAHDSDPRQPAPPLPDTEFTTALRQVVHGHQDLLARFSADIEKFLFFAPQRLAKREEGYSWEIEQALSVEIDRLLDGIAGPQQTEHSIGFLARCHPALGPLISKPYLRTILRWRYRECRRDPLPGFLQTLEHARSLTGEQFEEFLVEILRKAGIENVSQTPASRDQGVDLLVALGSRIVAIQAKQYTDPVGNAAVQEVLAGLHYYRATEAWVVTTSVFTRDAIDLAARCNVHLVDGSRLLNLPEMLQALGAAPRGQQREPTRDEGVRQPPSSRAETGATRFRFRQPAALLAGLLCCCVLVALLVVRPVLASRERGRIEPEVRLLLERWRTTTESADTVGNVACYEPVVRPFFLRAQATSSEVAREKSKAFAAFPLGLKVKLSDIRFDALDAERAVLTFDKEWDAVGKTRFAGKERQRLTLRKNCPDLADRRRRGTQSLLDAAQVGRPRAARD